MCTTEIIFEVSQDEADGGYSASALGWSIYPQGGSVDGMRGNVREAVDCHFHETMSRPTLIRLRFVREEILVARGWPDDVPMDASDRTTVRARSFGGLIG